MTRIIVAAHGHLAEAIVSSAELIMGAMPTVRAVTFHPGQGVENLLAAYETESEGEPALFLVDIYGGSPFNAAARWVLEHDDSDIVAGVNLGMLVEVASSAITIDDIPTLVGIAESTAKDSIRSFRANYQELSSHDDDEGDEI